MKHPFNPSILFIVTLLTFICCQCVPKLPVPGDPAFEMCSSCEEFLLDSHLHVVPSRGGLVSIWDDRVGWLARDMYPDWEALSPSDTLVLVRNAKGRYTFIHAIFGVYWTPGSFDKAWPYSEGVAAVMENKRVRFIDSLSEPAVEGFSFPWNGYDMDQPVFRNGVCPVATEDRLCGVIDHQGRWVIGPAYKDVQLLDEGILCEGPGLSVLYSYDGTVLNPCIVEHVSTLTLSGKAVGLCIYETGGLFGLMDAEGRRLTDPIYSRISAQTRNLFAGTLSDLKSSVVLNRRGEVVSTTSLVQPLRPADN